MMKAGRCPCMDDSYINRALCHERSRTSQLQSPKTMALSLFLSAFLLTSTVTSQAYDPVARNDGAFSYIQPLNTTILTQYGSSPAILPSRKAVFPVILR